MRLHARRFEKDFKLSLGHLQLRNQFSILNFLVPNIWRQNSRMILAEDYRLEI